MRDEWLLEVLCELRCIAAVRGMDCIQPHLEAAFEAALTELKAQNLTSINTFQFHRELLAKGFPEANACDFSHYDVVEGAEGRSVGAVILMGPWKTPKAAAMN